MSMHFGFLSVHPTSNTDYQGVTAKLSAHYPSLSAPYPTPNVKKTPQPAPINAICLILNYIRISVRPLRIPVLPFRIPVLPFWIPVRPLRTKIRRGRKSSDELF